jgi:hypothetical protein
LIVYVCNLCLLLMCEMYQVDFDLI